MKLILITSLTLSLASSADAFNSHATFHHRITNLVHASHQDMFNAQEDAAFDAHNLSDAGMEAAVMARYAIVRK